jgi:hypothetical protein
LTDLPLDKLIEILTSAKPLHQILTQRSPQNGSSVEKNGVIEVDPHARVDTSTFLLQRTRRVSWALDALRDRLERPVASAEALNWRLRGPVGVEAISRAIIKEAKSSEEGAFLLVELILELARVRPGEMPGGLSVQEIKSELRRIINQLSTRLSTESLPQDPAFRSYIFGALTTAS